MEITSLRKFKYFLIAHYNAFRWLLDAGNVMQPIISEDSLEIEAERELLCTAETAHRALQHAAVGVDESWQHGIGGMNGELAQMQSVLGLLFGGQVSPEPPSLTVRLSRMTGCCPPLSASQTTKLGS